jgi:mannose-1-phosphate guanylyltransferase/mannose-6-phosphate isomerase
MAQTKIRPVVLAGGSGVRLWPLSREAAPKQLLPLVGDETLLQQTLKRVAAPGFQPPIIVCNDQYRFLIGEQVREAGIEGAEIVLEPVARNSAAAAAVGAIISERADPSALVLLLPSDHVIRDVVGFRSSVDIAAAGAAADFLMTFGVAPTYAAGEYGYIRIGDEIQRAPGCRTVAKFVEKPDRAKAEQLLAQGGHVWNSGMFMFRPQTFLAELKQLEPKILDAARGAVEKGVRDLGFLRLDKESFAQSPNISIDYAVMERTARAATCPLASDWSDLGSWSAIWDVLPHDDADNAVQGDVVLQDARGCMVRSDARLTAVVGLEDAVVVTTDDAVLVAAKERAQDVRKIVDQLKAKDRKETRENTVTHRPWGKYQSIDHGARYQVKLITVNPGASLSLQLHHHRSEHWVVVSGTGKVTRGDEVFHLYENQSTFIPVGVKHRLENPGHIPLQMIEVQTGGYLGEDDIVRFDDRYGRTPAK